MDVLIIHYNTPELTSATIKSLWKFTPNASVTIFDNSDKRPFPIEDFPTVKYLDNTNGKIVNWEEWLDTFPNKEPCPENNYGSAKHCYSVELCYDMFKDGFVLMDSDVLIKKDITPLCDKTKAFTGRIHCNTRHVGAEIYRVCPWICWINTPMLKKHGVRYFNPNKMWKLHADHPKEYYDTGAWLLEETLRLGLPYTDLEINDYIVHLRAASWHKFNGHVDWLNKYKHLWWSPDSKIYICAHKDFKPIVSNPAYEVIDSRYTKVEGLQNGLLDAFYSELYQYRYVLERGDLPDFVGFCGYRKYFDFLDNVPTMKDIFKQYDAIATSPFVFKTSVFEHYKGSHNVHDMEIVSTIIKKDYPKFWRTFENSLQDNKLYPCNMFIVRKEDFVEIMSIVFDILDKYIEVVGTDIEKRVADNPIDYHIGEKPLFTPEYEYRIGGFLGERIISALLQYKFKKMKLYNRVILKRNQV